ncbi:MAG: murein biosynthesis integral membrane protein MurJ [Chloroflexi bacterium]|nr:murein biosynthesis integral membrane protein MurJ [Chloroflexota bacterium]
MIESPDPPDLKPTPIVTAVDPSTTSPKNLGEDEGVVKAAAVLAVGNIASRVLGLSREIVKSNLYGASPVLAAYTVAVLVPMTLFNLISGGEMVSSSLVPVFSDFARKEKRDELWQVASTVLTLAVIVLSGIVLLVELFAEQVAWLAGARNFSNPELFQVTVDLMRLATPAVLFLSIASVLSGLLYALKRFNYPAFVGAVFNGTIVLAALARPDEIDSLVWGMLLGSFLQIIIQLPGLRDGRFHLRFNWHHPALRRITILYTPILVGLVINQIAIWISYRLAILTGDNSVTYMGYATTLYQFPLGLVVTALSVATLPTLSQIASAYHETKLVDKKAAAAKVEEFKSTLAGGLRLVITLILPAGIGLFSLAPFIVALLLEHGRFTSVDTEITVRVLRFYLLGLAFAGIDQMLVFASYARKDTWRPALAGVIAIGVYTATAVLLLKSLGLYSLMIADAIKHIVHTALMFWFLQRHMGGLHGYGIVRLTVKAMFAAVVTGLLALVVAQLMSRFLPLDGFASRLIIVAVGSLTGFAAYVGMVWLLDIPEAQSLYRMLKSKLKRPSKAT